MPLPHAFSVEPHDHQHCIDTAIDAATRLCAERGMRFTKIRQNVFSLIWSGHQPIGAYAILEALKTDYPRAAPPTVYRALDFLIEIGLIHRIESMNAFVGCTHPDNRHTGQFLICENCGAAAELDDPSINKAVQESAGTLGFLAQRQMIEVRGLCPDCQTAIPG
jgi:Fur family zinc uptake transcriptional regulator